MVDPQSNEKTIWVLCSSCGHNHRNHRILYEKENYVHEDPFGGGLVEINYHRFVQCMGCETFKYVSSSVDCQNSYHDERIEENFKVYPDTSELQLRRRSAISFDDNRKATGGSLIPAKVMKMYKETLDSLNHDILTLAAGGLRATVEAICLDRGIVSGSLQKKIDELATRNFLTSAQAELLHEERYLGNSALHELETPSGQAIEDGLGIVEGLINTIYILPDKAARLRARREPPSE